MRRTSTRLVARRAEPLDLAGLQHAQQLDLDLLGELAHLVEEERATVRQLEPAGPHRGRAREGAALVPEQLAFDERRRQRAAVDRDEGPAAAATAAVDRARDELLARAGFAGHQHRRVGHPHLGDLLVQPHHGGRAAHHVVEIGPVLEILAVVDLLEREAGLQLGDLPMCLSEGPFATCSLGGVSDSGRGRHPTAGHERSTRSQLFDGMNGW